MLVYVGELLCGQSSIATLVVAVQLYLQTDSNFLSGRLAQNWDEMSRMLRNVMQQSLCDKAARQGCLMLDARRSTGLDERLASARGVCDRICREGREWG